MAWIFSAWVQCATSEQALAVAAHFDKVSRTDSVACETTLCADTCCWVVPTKARRTGIHDAQTAAHLSELGYWLYGVLRSAPAYQLAMVGVEVDDVRSDEDIMTIVRDTHPAYRGLVISETYWRRAGCPPQFEPFASGLRWRPYEGEALGR